MKIFYAVFIFLLLFYQQAFATRVYDNGCYYDCHEEKSVVENHFTTYKKVVHTDYFKEIQYVERTSTPIIGPDEVLYDCKNYKDWDNIVEDTNRGKPTGYKVIDNKLFTTEGKRYLRCNDPENEKWIKRWTEQVEIVTPFNWTEFIPIDNIDYLTISKWICYPISYYYGGSRGGGGRHHHGGGGSLPVPEPATLILFGIGLLGLASIKKLSK